MVVCNFFTLYLLANRTPQGWEIAKYGDFRPVWPRTAFGTWRNLGRGLKIEKHNLPALEVPKSKTGNTLSGMVVRNFFYILRFARPDPQGWEIAKYWFFCPFGLG